MWNPPNMGSYPVAQTLTGGIDTVIVAAAPGLGFRLRLWAVSFGYNPATPARNPVGCILTDNTNTALVANWRAVLGLSTEQPSTWLEIPGGKTLGDNAAIRARLQGTNLDQVVVVVYATTEAV